MISQPSPGSAPPRQTGSVITAGPRGAAVVSFMCVPLHSLHVCSKNPQKEEQNQTDLYSAGFTLPAQ